MLKIGVLDDNVEHLDDIYAHIVKSLDKRGLSYHIDKAQDLSFYKDLLEKEQFDYDVLFWDIQLETETTLPLARDIFELYPHIQMIYVTNYNQYIKDVFQSHVSYFIDKNDLEEKMDDIIDKIMNVLFHQKLLIKNKDSVHMVNMHHVMYIERKLRVSYIYEKENRCYRSREKLSEFMCKLNHKFIRTHNSFIVNVDYIETMTRTSVYLTNGMVIPVSRQYYQKLKERLFI